MRMLKWLTVLFYCFAQHALAADEAIEKQIQSYAQKNAKTQMTLLTRLVNINSGTNNLPGVSHVGKIVQKQLQSMGFKTRWVEQPKAMHRVGTLIAVRQGERGKHLLLIGHFDTVFSPTSTFKKVQMREHTAKGPGIADDKGGLVVMLYALKTLQAMHALDGTSITVVLTGDEEDSGKPTSISRKALVDAAKNQDVALDFEPSITLDTASISRRGVSSWLIESHGNESHSATIFQKDVGDGAIFESSRILNEMRTTLAAEKYLSFNPGIVLAGTKADLDAKAAKGEAFGRDNVVAKIAVTKGDLRFIDPAQLQDIRDKMKKIVINSLPGTHSTIVFNDGIPALSPSNESKQLLKQYSDASVRLGYGPVTELDAGMRGAGDISFVSDIVPAKLIGLGPTGFGTHSVGEYVDLNSLPIQTERAALLIYQLTQ